MRICLVSAEYPPETASGGIGTYMHNLSRALVRQGHDVTVVSASPSGHRTSEVRDGVRVERFSAREIPLVRRLRRGERGVTHSLRRYGEGAASVVRELQHDHGRFDVAEAALWNAEAASWGEPDDPPLITRLVTPVFAATKVATHPRLTGVERLERQQLVRSTVLAAISRDIGTLITQHYELTDARVALAPLGVPLRSAVDLSGRPLRLLYVGRLERRKGTDLLLHALPAILGRCDDVEVDIVGRDTGQAHGGSYTALANTLLTPDQRARVHFHGFVDDSRLQGLYDQASVFVAPSRYESFGLVYLEAMSRGVPVIGTAVGGVIDIVDDTVGRLIEPESSEALAEACLALLLDDGLRVALGVRARERVAAEFSDDAMAGRTAALYESVRGV